jgi:histidinol-phosphate aminotransferase
MPILGLKASGPSLPAHFSLEPLIRPNILALTPYRCARDDYSAGVLLDANENALGPALPAMNGHQAYSLLSDEEIASLNRYPSPTHDELKQAIARFRGVPDENWVFLGVGSDEVIDMLYRVLCVPGKDVVLTTPPTYGMYKVTANVNDVGVLEVPLIVEDGAFQLDEQAVRDCHRISLMIDVFGIQVESRLEDALHLLARQSYRHGHPPRCDQTST